VGSALIGRDGVRDRARAYQHPSAAWAITGLTWIAFSALVIYLSLRALEIDRKLWEQYYTGDNLLFVREDFNEAGRSPIWGDLARPRGPRGLYLAGVLAAMVSRRSRTCRAWRPCSESLAD